MKKKQLGLSGKIFIALILGIGMGVVMNIFQMNGLLNNIIKPVGTIFLNLMKMIIMPLILATLVSSITNVGDMNRLGMLGKKTILYYMATTIMAAFIGIVLAIILKPGVGIVLTTAAFDAPQQASIPDLIVSMVPSNPFKSLTDGNTLQVIIFGGFLGIAITLLGEKVDNIKNLFSSFADIMYKIVEIIMKVAPIAVFALIADLVATNGWEVLVSLIKLMLVIIIASLIQCLVVYSGSVTYFGKISPMKFFKAVIPAQMLSFSTASSAATLPVSMKCAEEELGISRTVSNFVLNLGSTINMDGGAIYQAACAVFIAQMYGVHLSVTQLIIILVTASLASVGAAAIPGTVIVMMTMVLSAVGLPLDAIALIAGIDRILDMVTTSVNVTGDLAACVFVASSQENTKEIK
ncbi:MAG: dicarboxylate/amino acid:cation symporter [Cellulosilyticaceae bacterium]